MDIKIALTGASGFVGRYVVSDLRGTPIGDATHRADVRDYHKLVQVLTDIKPDALLHLAANSFVPGSFADPLGTFEVNFLGTLNLLQALEATGFMGRFLYVGSADVYGLVAEDELPIVEDRPLRPRNPYAVSKTAAEALCYQWSQTGPFEIIMVRPFNHIGPGQDDRFVVANFARQIVEIKMGRRDPVLRVGNIDVSRDFTDVRDVVRAYGALLEHGRNGEVYNVCSGKEHRLGVILDNLMELAGVDVEVKCDPSRLRPSEQRRAWGSNAKLVQQTSWSATWPIKYTLKDILGYWERKLNDE